MYHNNQIPDVVDLNVNGVDHKALLSTLTKDDDSILASMFNGQQPVYTDNKGRYFLEANGSTFGRILHYLSYGELHINDYVQRLGGLFGGGSGLGQRAYFSSTCNLTTQELKAMYADAVKYGLTSLVKKLEQYEPILMEKKKKDFCQSLGCYDETMNKILSIIPVEAAFYDNEFTLRLIQDGTTTTDDKCCEHVCQPCHWQSNTFQDVRLDETVKASCEITVPFLSALVMDLKSLGYAVQGLVSRCGYICQKKMKQSKYVRFNYQENFCCDEHLLLLTFKFGPDSHVTQLAFGPKRALFGRSSGNGFCFSTPGEEGFSFGSQNKSAFGSAPASQPNQNCFGSASSNQGLFGSARNSSEFGFGGSSTNQGLFGSTQNTTGFGCGSASTNQGLFGSTQNTAGFSFGSTPPKHSSFGSAQNTTGFGCGNASTNQGLFGSTQNTAGFSFGSTPPKQGSFGSAQNTAGFGFGSASTNQGSFGGAQNTAGFGSPHNQESNPNMSLRSQLDPAFGSSRGFHSPTNTEQSSTDSLQQKQGVSFGGVQQPSSLFGNSSQQRGSLFGGSSQQQGSVFGGSSQQQGSVFGGSSQQQGSVFGGSSQQQGSVFGGSSQQQGSVFGGSSQQRSPFGKASLEGLLQNSSPAVTKQQQGFSFGGSSTTKSQSSTESPKPDVKNSLFGSKVTSTTGSTVTQKQPITGFGGFGVAKTAITTGFSFVPPITAGQTTKASTTSSQPLQEVKNVSSTVSTTMKTPSFGLFPTSSQAPTGLSISTTTKPLSLPFGAPIFGGNATFASPFKASSLDQSSDSVKSEELKGEVEKAKKIIDSESSDDDDDDGDGDDDGVKKS